LTPSFFLRKKKAEKNDWPFWLFFGRASGSGWEIQVIFNQGEIDMGDTGKKDKGKREQQKKAVHTQKEKRKLKKEEKRKQSPSGIG
jgi:hypothetical protein